MAHMTLADFEARYREDPDPWSYTSSEYERDKYRATLDACGPGPFGSAIELGSSIGVFSALLAPRCHSLVTVDAAPTAVEAARHRLAGYSSVTPILGTMPQAIPDRPYDLVVASEVLYYLEPADLAGTLVALRECMTPRARLVAVHWRPGGPERPFDAAQVHALVRGQSWLAQVMSGATENYLIDVLERR
jgi:cyclopropane fatty-acyl-phospholipid synthase-like methyltransferase